MIAPFVALLVLSSAPSVRVAVGVTASGIADGDLAALRKRAIAEVGSHGVDATGTDSSKLRAACLNDAACVRGLLDNAGATMLIVLDVLRAGPRATVQARWFRGDGRIEGAESTATTAAALARAPLLVPGVVTRLQALTATPETPAAGSTHARSQPSSPVSSTAAATMEGPGIEPSGEGAVPPAAMAGIGLAALGGVAAFGGFGVTAGQAALLGRADAPGADREAAAVVLPLAASIGAVGLAIGVGGIVLLATSQDAVAAPGG